MINSKTKSTLKEGYEIFLNGVSQVNKMETRSIRALQEISNHSKINNENLKEEEIQ
jgi:hypothetical protein